MKIALKKYGLISFFSNAINSSLFWHKDVQTMPGFKSVLFCGEGLFVTTLT